MYLYNLLNIKGFSTCHAATLSHCFGIWFMGIVGIVPLVSAETDCNAGVSLVPVEQCETLLIFYHSTGGDKWLNNEGWNTTDEPRDFALIETDDDGNVVALNLFGNRLAGNIPDLSNLTNLEELNLFSNKLAGTLPNFTALTNLREMNLRNNKLTGQIPELNSLTQIEKISLFHNQLCGQIPDFRSLTKLTQLDLSQNKLSGPIPDLSGLKNLRNLGLNGNQLCRDENNDYSGFEYAVNDYPLCSEDDQYPACDNMSILTVIKNGIGTITGEGIECGDDCSEEYVDNPEVTLTATPAANSIFAGWTGACSGTTSCQITMNQAQNVTATFDEIPSFTLIVNPEGNGTVTGMGINCGSDCSEQYAENSEVTLTAEPGNDSIFAGWTGACSGTLTSCQITMSQAQNVTATFNQAAVFALTVVNQAGTGIGTIIGNGINCGSDCSAEFIENTDVTLTAEPAAGSVFAGWAGACSGTLTSCQITMSKAQNVTATFNQAAIFALTVNQQGTSTGTIIGNGINCGSDCSEEFMENTEVTLTAEPAAGSAFVGWTGACSDATPSCSVVMNQAQTLTATFNLVQTIVLPELEFIGLKDSYNVGEWFRLDLVEHLQTAPAEPRINLWIAVEDSNNTFYYMTETLLQLFSLTPQPYRRNIITKELADIEAKYHLFSLDVYPGIEGSYTFYAFYSSVEADSDEILFRQLSNVTTATTFFTNRLNSSPLPLSQEPLTMLIGEELELVVDSEIKIDTLLSTCTVAPIGIIQSIAAPSTDGTSISCYVKALQQGDAILTTTYMLQTPITVR